MKKSTTDMRIYIAFVIKRSLPVLCCFFALHGLATDFHVSLLNEHKTLVYGRIQMTSKSLLEIEVVDTIIFKDSNHLEMGMKLSVPFYNHHYDLSDERDAVVALKYDDNRWRVEHIFVGNKEEDFNLKLKNRLSSITVSVQEFAEALKLLYADLTVITPEDRSWDYTHNLGKVSLKVDKEKWRSDISSNAFLMHLFKEWDYFQCFKEPLGFGFWYDLEEKKELLIRSQKHSRVIPLDSSETSFNQLFTRFIAVDSLERVTKDFLYFFDPRLDSLIKVYDFIPDASIPASNNTTVKWMHNYGYQEVCIPLRVFFGDNYFSHHSGLSPLQEPKELILPVYPVSGILNFYSISGDTLIGQLTNGTFTGKLNYFKGDTLYEMNFNEKGQAHGPSLISLGKMGKILHYEHFSNIERSGHYYSTFASGEVQLTGSYFNSQRIGEWIEYYPIEDGGGIKSKNNYMYFDPSIEFDGQDSLCYPILLSTRCVDQYNWRRLHGFQIYYESTGEVTSLQKWNSGMLEHRQDWFKQTIDIALFDDTLGSIRQIANDSVYHTNGVYKMNKPWSGSFLVGVNQDVIRGTAGGRGPHIRISVDNYQNGLKVASDIIFDSHPGQLMWYEIQEVNEQSLDKVKPAKKRLFRRKK